MPYTILLVDDEPHVLSGLRRALHAEPFAIRCARSSEEAFAVLRAQAIDVVVSDHDMPGTPGTVFLAAVRRAFPETVRFMLTGKPTLDVAMQAINEGAISRFFTKPCNHVDLAVTIRQAIQQKELMAAAKQLLRTVQSRSAALARLEHQYPGITKIYTDAEGAIIAKPVDISVDDLVQQLRREAAKATGRQEGHI